MDNWVEQSLATQYADVNADAEQINFMLDDDNDLENKAIFLKKFDEGWEFAERYAQFTDQNDDKLSTTFLLILFQLIIPK